MGYPRGQRKRRIGVIAIAVGVGILLVHYTGIGAPVENMILRIIQPLQTQLYRASQGLTSQRRQDLNTRSTEELIQRIEELEKKQQESTVTIAHLQTVVDEAQLLEKQVQFLQERSLTAVTARVTSRSTEQLSQSLMINRGRADGIAEGMPVIVDNGIVVGTIQAASDHAAEVLLTTSYDSRLNARLQNLAQSPGVVRGEHNISLFMEFIPQLDVISVGDIVVTNGADPLVPLGLVIGQVKEILNTQGSLFQQASLTPLFSPSDIFIVSVVLP